MTGGAACALSDLLNVPGASRTVLELRVPYAPAALRDLLGFAAGAGHLRGHGGGHGGRLPATGAGADADGSAGRIPADANATGEAVVGVACTAALASDRPKRGEHRAHVALCDGDRTRVWTLALDKGARTRPEEDRLAGDVVLGVLAEACGLPARWPALGPGDRLTEEPRPTGVARCPPTRSAPAPRRDGGWPARGGARR